MENFRFFNPTAIIFGRDTEKLVGAETKKRGKRVLVHFGGGSIKKSGLYDRVVGSLRESGIEFFELGGVKPNPRLSLVREGVDLCRKNNVDFILAVGGGSVIDSAKAIALGATYAGDVWDFYMGKTAPTEALPIGCVLTIPAAGSESSQSSVITNEEGKFKRFCDTEILRPSFAIMNPELSFTLPPYQTACGASDIMAHVMERYFTNSRHVELTDRLCESTLKTVIDNAPTALPRASELRRKGRDHVGGRHRPQRPSGDRQDRRLGVSHDRARIERDQRRRARGRPGDRFSGLDEICLQARYPELRPVRGPGMERRRALP